MSWAIIRYKLGAKGRYLEEQIPYGDDGVPAATKFFEIEYKRGEYPFSYQYELCYQEPGKPDKIVQECSANYLFGLKNEET